MTSIDDAAKVSFGILQPAIKYRFQVSFLDSDHNELPFSSDLTRQVTSVSSYVQTRDPTIGCELIVIKIEEDLTQTAMSAMQKLLKLDGFTVLLNTLDGNETTMKKVYIDDARVSNILHSDLDYCGGSHIDRAYLKLEIPEPMGTAINVIRDKSPEAEMIFQLLARSQFSLVRDDYQQSNGSSAVSSSLVIGYDSSKVTVEIGPFKDA